MRRLCKMIAVFTTGLLLAGSASANETVTVTDVSGQQVEVSVVEINKAYFTSYEPMGLNHRITNGDDSVTILNPVFDYAGKKIPYTASNSKQNLGICKHFGFTSAHGIEWVQTLGPVVRAYMDTDGNLNSIEQKVREHGYLYDLVSTIVCSNR